MKKITATFKYLLSVHVLALLILSFIRIILLLNNLSDVVGEDHKFSLICTALLKGVWFDNVIACYIAVLPLVTLSVLGLFNVINRTLVRCFSIFYMILFGVVFAISVSDISYFGYFFKHIDSSIFNWKEEGGIAMKMIFQESTYYIYFAIYIIIMILFVYLVLRFDKQLTKKQYTNIKDKNYFLYIPVSLVIIGSCFLGIRGRFGYNPIRISQAFFCNNSFLNHLGINPTFYLIRDIIENSKKHNSVNNLVSEQDAIKTIESYLSIDPDKHLKSPVAREIKTVGEPNDMNVVIVLMESMSMDFLDIRRNGKSITPYLHELIGKSYFFDNFYSTGTHTNHGVLGTICGLPSLLDKNAMKNVQTPICQGIASTLRHSAYKTMFFLSHEAQYDNMQAFLKENDFEDVYSRENYPESEAVNVFGVPDQFLFNFAMPKITEAYKTKRPFLATVLTISNHPPFIIPKEFESVSDYPEEQIVAYADDAIRNFMTEASKQEWYSNTIFVFLGDHGKIIGKQTYEMPRSLNHIPLIIYSPAFKDAPKQFHQLGGQIDVFPTIMGLLDIPYLNNTFGVDIFKENRRFIPFSSDNMLGCVDDKFFYFYSFNTKQEHLYDYRNNSTVNVVKEYKNLADSMRIYSAAHLRVTEYMYMNKLTRITK